MMITVTVEGLRLGCGGGAGARLAFGYMKQTLYAARIYKGERGLATVRRALLMLRGLRVIVKMFDLLHQLFLVPEQKE
jgi:hypothetical protein